MPLSDLLPLLTLGPAALVAALDALDTPDHAWGWVGDDLALLCVGAAFVGALLGHELPALAPVAHAAVVLALLLWALPVVLDTAGGACRAWGRPNPHPPRRRAFLILAAGALLLGQAVAPPGPAKIAPGLHAAGPSPAMEVAR